MVPSSLLRASALSLLALTLAWPASHAFAQAPKPGATPAPTEDERPTRKGPADQPAIPVARAKGSAGTLVFTTGETGSQGSQFTTVTVSALPAAAGPAELGYEKFLGPMTMKSLEQVLQSSVAMHHGWPQGKRFQITFNNRPSPSELNPATLAMALALDSMLRDYDLDPSYAAIGWIQEDGSVEAVGSIPERMLGASRAQVARVVVPEKNFEQLSDYLLGQGMGAFVSTQVFTVKDFNQAGVLAVKNLDPKVQEVITLFKSLQKTLAFGSGNVALLKTEPTQNLLKKVLEAAPNHASAQILLDWGSGKKATMSFNGSVDVIDRRAPGTIKAFRANLPETLKTKRDLMGQEIAAIRFVFDRLDPRARPYAGALARYADALQKILPATGKPPAKLPPAAETALDTAKTQAEEEWAKLAKIRQEISEQKQKEKEEAK